MSIHVRLRLNLWANIIYIVIYLIIRGPSMALDGGIPKEMWTSKKVNYSFLRFFICKAFTHVDK